MPKSTAVLELPPTGFLRASQIIGDRKKGIPALLPVSRSLFWAMVRDGRFDQGVLLTPRCRGWRVEAVLSAIREMSNPQAIDGGAK
jgi:prophage regulatory protein